MSSLEQITAPLAHHGEGPCWSRSWGGLRWVDMLNGDLLTLRPSGEVDRLHVSGVAAFVRPRVGGGYVVGIERGIALADQPDEAPRTHQSIWSDEGVRMNEGACDTAGNLYAGSMAYGQVPEAAALYRISPSGDVSVVLTNVTVSNGLDFAPDGSRAYYNDTATGRTDVFDVVGGEFINRRPFHHGDGGRPDGLCVDSEGNVWVALNRSGKVRCYSPSGHIVTEHTLPVRLTTACTLGGEDRRDLFITTSRQNLSDPEPEAGAVFRIRVDTPGRVVAPYGG